MSKNSYVGKIDSYDGKFLRGWVCDRAHPYARQSVDVFAGTTFVGQTGCGFYRPDLEAAGFGDGRHEFLIWLGNGAAGEPTDVYVRVCGAPQVILKLNSAGAEETSFEGSDVTRRKAYFATLLNGLRFASNGSCRRSEHAVLTKCVPIHGIPLSSFGLHLSRKFGFDVSDKKDFDRFLSYYFEWYAPKRAPYKLPLSPQESKFWAAPELHVCRAGNKFAPLPTRQSTTDRIFGWTVHDAARLGVEDAWIDESLVIYLQGNSNLFERSRDFPINRFLRRFLKQNAALDGLHWNDVRDRQIAYTAVVLHASRMPHFLRLLPQKWLCRLLERREGETRLLSNVLTEMLGHEPNLAPIFERTDLPTMPALHDPVPGQNVVDVQLIGPFDRVLGLSESCRRFAEAVRSCGYSVAFANYDLGSASPRESQSAIPDELVKARINILHLNMEEIPEALAFSLAPLVGSYLIAISYFELSSVSECHELGLLLIDEIWAPSRFLMDLYSAEGKTTVLMPLPVRAPVDLCPDAARNYVLTKLKRSDPVTLYLTTADALSWVGRKHTIGVLDAFQAAFAHDEPVCLIVKIHNINQMTDPTQAGIWAEIVVRAEADSRIVLVTETIAADAYRMLLAGVDCLVSLHRAEGLGINILDAMMLGTAVVATAYSGNVDVCDATTSWPVAFDLVPVGLGNYPYAERDHMWAEPRLPAAAAALLDVHARPEERAARAAKAWKRISEHNDPEAAAERIGARIGAILETL